MHHPRSKSVIPNLSLGLSLSSPYLLSDRLDAFMRRMLVSRISRRVLAEHHIALTKSVKSGEHASQENVGIISTRLQVKDCIERCARYLRRRPTNVDEDSFSGPLNHAPWSEVEIDGHVDTKFAYIQEHLECVLSSSCRDSLVDVVWHGSADTSYSNCSRTYVATSVTFAGFDMHGTSVYEGNPGEASYVRRFAPNTCNSRS